MEDRRGMIEMKNTEKQHTHAHKYTRTHKHTRTHTCAHKIERPDQMAEGLLG